MKNSVEFAFYVEKESAISQLNRFMLKEFRHKTHLWSNEASHNIILWLTRGSATYIDERDRLSLEMSGKVISIKRGSSYIIEAEADSLLLTYSFDDYLPFDIESLKLSDNEKIVNLNRIVSTDISYATFHELGSVITNFKDIRNNEALTFISLERENDSFFCSFTFSKK